MVWIINTYQDMVLPSYAGRSTAAAMGQMKFSIYRLQAKSVYLYNLKNTIIVSYREISDISEFHKNLLF